MTSKDKTTTANVVRMNTNEASKYLEWKSWKLNSKWVIGRPGFNQDLLGGSHCSCGVKFRRCCTIFWHLTLEQIIEGNNINGSRLAF